MAIERTDYEVRLKHAAVAVFTREQDVIQAVRSLYDQGFARERISLLAKDRDALAEATRESGALDGCTIDPPESLAQEVEPKGRDEVWGMSIGGTVGLIVGLASIWIPGFGAFLLASGPMAIAAQALTVSAAGVGMGALLGAIFDERVTEEHREFYERELAAGHWLVVVHADAKDDARRAADTLKNFTASRVEAY